MAQKRIAEVTTPIEGLELRRMHGYERIGQPFCYELELLSKSDKIAASDVLGQSMTVHLEVFEKKVRHFNGLVAGFSRMGADGSRTRYKATLRPWLWMLTHSSDCRIFQNMKVPDVIARVFRDHTYSDFQSHLMGDNYREWEYLVQYRETAFNFVSRLMEQEGIYYFFEHTESTHTMVMTDSRDAHTPFAGYEKVSYWPRSPGAVRKRDHVDDLLSHAQLKVGTHALNDFDFKKPKADLKVRVPAPAAKVKFEAFDPPGGYLEQDDGNAYAKYRMEASESQFAHVEGAGNAAGLCAGATFELENFPRSDLNRKYLLTSVTHALTSETFESGRDSGTSGYRCEFSAIDSQTQFRLERTTPKPRIAGAQTAIVVGGKGQDVWTDKYGRVRLQFHWDRYGKSDEGSSCLVRVAQVWAGSRFGAVFTPRVGHEVVVEFLEGDPDRPLVVGCVYNEDNLPAYDLPKDAFDSGIRSRSANQGNPDNFNEIRFKDQRGSELLFVQAERDHETNIKNDQRHKVGHDRAREVGNDESIEIGQNRVKNVAKNETLSVGENQDEKVGGDASLSVSGGRTTSITGDEQLKVGGERKQSIASSDSLSVGTTMTVSAGQEITIKAGAASLVLRASGEIVLNGVVINVKGSSGVAVQAGGVLALKGSQVTQN